MAEIRCLTDEELLPISCGETVAEAARGHLLTCSTCSDRVERLRAELADVRSVLPSAPPASLTFHPAPPNVETLSANAHPTGPRSHEVAANTIGRFTVLRRLAVEGQSEVYLARHPTLEREVVLKLGHHPITRDAPERDRLVKEARLLAELGEQPYLVRIHDLDFHQDRPFLVMEYVRGANLHQRAKQHRYAPHESALLVAKLARGLAAPHQLGVTHRDLKPSNVLIDPQGEPRIIDFGLALQCDAWGDDRESPGTVAGTISFMAPEQARGEMEKVGPASDLFALGGILYFLLTDQAPFPGKTFDEALNKARDCEFDRQLLTKREVPPRLAAICLRAMSAKPEDRYPHAETLAEELERFARPRRPMLPLVLATVCLLLAVGVGIGALMQSGEKEKPGTPPPEETPKQPGPQHLLQVNDQTLGPLTRPVPLREGDRLKIRCEVPSGMKAALFWLDTSGTMEEPSGVEVTSAEPFDQLIYPGASQVVRLPRPKTEGTVLALVLASREEKPRLEDVKTLWSQQKAASLSLLPGDLVMMMDRESVHPLSIKRSLGEKERDAQAEVQDTLATLRPLLRQRYDFIAGVAVGYVK